mmetsp:Transcript_10839/g.25970  ORF Transcript_10839/g.25970 Transcript_10839/m.25970 type:complete len:382 (+) Transcript_10839:386-1531(+)
MISTSFLSHSAFFWCKKASFAAPLPVPAAWASARLPSAAAFAFARSVPVAASGFWALASLFLLWAVVSISKTMSGCALMVSCSSCLIPRATRFNRRGMSCTCSACWKLTSTWCSDVEPPTPGGLRHRSVLSLTQNDSRQMRPARNATGDVSTCPKLRPEIVTIVPPRTAPFRGWYDSTSGGSYVKRPSSCPVLCLVSTCTSCSSPIPFGTMQAADVSDSHTSRRQRTPPISMLFRSAVFSPKFRPYTPTHHPPYHGPCALALGFGSQFSSPPTISIAVSPSTGISHSIFSTPLTKQFAFSSSSSPSPLVSFFSPSFPTLSFSSPSSSSSSFSSGGAPAIAFAAFFFRFICLYAPPAIWLISVGAPAIRACSFRVFFQKRFS